MPFKLSKDNELSTESPVSLFLDLRTRKIPGLLVHQADVLREYTDSALEDPDVAFQLPTGSGKTLVGLILGEWRRRRAVNEQVIYLCPTNQLVYQVVEQAQNKYGIKVNGFTGSKRDYDPCAKAEYLNNEAIGVTSYSALFNTNPFFANPHLIILDDAHSAENYIATLWSVAVSKHDHEALFSVLVSLLEPILPSTDYQRLTGSWRSYLDGGWSDKIPTTDFYELIPELVKIIDTHSEDMDLRFSWSLIRDHLDACHLYISPAEILIRPLIPPTSTHQPFSGAKQRVYMSATLGEGGELERLTGRKNITRLKIPPGWDKQGIGRRFFLFPARSLDEEQTSGLVLDAIRKAGRALSIVPNNKDAERFDQFIKTNLGFSTFSAREIETSKTSFVTSDQAVAIVANRYDGIDFIDDECRLLIVYGLPRTTNLQERFLIYKMGASRIFDDRVLTRVLQAFGRCTRSATDYAAVIILGEELNTYLLTRDRRTFLHPELQAELEFGIEQSKDVDNNGFLDNLDSFFAQDEGWTKADSHLLSRRNRLSQEPLPGTSDLNSAVCYELDYQDAMWKGDFDEALSACRKVISKLDHSDLRGYRGLWHYLAGSAAWLCSQENMGVPESVSREYFGKAMSAAQGIRWLVRLSKSQNVSDTNQSDRANSLTMPLIERLENVLENQGTVHDRKYEKTEKDILENILENDSKKFEDAQKKLGWFLGFESGNDETIGAPDPWWIVDESLCIVFEDHSNAESESTLSVTKARQVATHPNWVKENLPLDKKAEIVTVLVSPVSVADPAALPHLENVCFWDIDEYRAWSKKAVSVIRELRKTFSGSGDSGWRDNALKAYQSNTMDPVSLVKMLKANSAAELLKP